jgi:hypothetical protein
MTTEDLGKGLGHGDTGAEAGAQALGQGDTDAEAGAQALGQGDTDAEAGARRAEPELSVNEALALVDRILAEPGRRRHLFSWLKAPGGGSEDWLPVDAYYPSNRLVVVCTEPSLQHVEVVRELVPAHGLRLLELRPEDFIAGREAVAEMLERRIAELGPSRRRPPDTAGSAVAPSTHGAASTARARTDSEAAGVLAGLALAVALVIEVYFGVARVGFGSGNVLLAFGLSLDACSRALGTLSAWRAGEREWAWWCALGGSPLTAGFALMQRSGPVKTEPAPLAGLVGLAAMVLLALAAVVGAAGG